MGEDDRQADQAPGRTGRHAGFGATMRAVFWSFFGVRKRSDYERDAANLNPVHVIVGALVGVLVFIGILVLAVHFALAM